MYLAALLLSPPVVSLTASSGNTSLHCASITIKAKLRMSGMFVEKYCQHEAELHRGETLVEKRIGAGFRLRRSCTLQRTEMND